MKYLTAIIVCVGIFFVYSLIGAALGWKRGGGVLPMMVLFAAMAAAWRALTRGPTPSPGPDAWTIRVHGKLRPMDFEERHLAPSVLRQLLNEGKLDPDRVLGCPPGGSEFRPLSEHQELLFSGAADSGAEDSDLGTPPDLAVSDEDGELPPAANAQRGVQQGAARNDLLAWLVGGVVMVVGVALLLFLFWPETSSRPDGKAPLSEESGQEPVPRRAPESPRPFTERPLSPKPKKAPENADTAAARALPLRSGWRRVAIPKIGTIDMPPTMEVQSGVFKTLGKAVSDALDADEPRGGTRLVLQQNGLNDGQAGASNLYARVIVEAKRATVFERATLTSLTDTELAEFSDGLRRMIEEQGAAMTGALMDVMMRKVQAMSDADLKDAFRPMLRSRGQEARLDRLTPADMAELRRVLVEKAAEQAKTKAPKLLEWHDATFERVAGRPAVCVSYRRQMGQAPPVSVKMYSLLDGDRTISVTLSYRETERQRWANDLDHVIKTFRVTNSQPVASRRVAAPTVKEPERKAPKPRSAAVDPDAIFDKWAAEKKKAAPPPRPRRPRPTSPATENEYPEFVAHRSGFAARFPGRPEKTKLPTGTNHAVVIEGEGAYNVHSGALPRPPLNNKAIEAALEGTLRGRLIVHRGARVTEKQMTSLLGHKAMKYEYVVAQSGHDIYFKGVILSKGKLIYTVNVVTFDDAKSVAYAKYAAFLKSFRLLE